MSKVISHAVELTDETLDLVHGGAKPTGKPALTHTSERIYIDESENIYICCKEDFTSKQDIIGKKKS